MLESELEHNLSASRSSNERRPLPPLATQPSALIVAALLVVTVLAWLLSYRNASAMQGIAMGLAQFDAMMPAEISAPLFMAMWLAMMVAMMFPAVAPIVLAHAAVVRQRGEGAWSTIAFVLGYLLIWTLIGLLPLGAFLAFQPLSMQLGPALPYLAAAILGLAGVYQFTPLKSVCLKACRNPIAFVLTHDFSTGARGAFQTGLSHGAYCLGCCWALMSILVVVGFMNLAWMGGLALLFFFEKTWRRGVALSRVAGAAIVMLAVFVVVNPSALTRISGS